MTDLTLSWTNVLSGNGTATMVYDGASAWQTACVVQMRFRLNCSAGGATFTATSFTGGPCPTGTPVNCTGPGPSPSGLAPSAPREED